MAPSYPLSKREREVAGLLLQGKSNKLIAASLGISIRTVEFHLKHIYAKYGVSSRVELILKLGNTAALAEDRELRLSTVAPGRQIAENEGTLLSPTDWSASLRDAFSGLGKELRMKNLFATKHVPVGMLTAVLTSLVWLALLMRFGHASSESVMPWVAPLIVTMALMGLAVGVVARRNAQAPQRVFLSTLVATGIGSVASLPLVALLVVPLGKLAEWLGLVNRATMPGDVASTLVYIGMLLMWLLSGTAVGTALLFVSIGRPVQVRAPEHGA